MKHMKLHFAINDSRVGCIPKYTQAKITTIKNIDNGIIYYIFRFKMRYHRHYLCIRWLVEKQHS